MPRPGAATSDSVGRAQLARPRQAGHSARDMSVTAAPTFADIQRAQAVIAPALVRTPTRHSRTLSGIAGCDVWLKFENRQFTASFKERGALNRILSLSAAERNRGVAAMSAG